MADENMTGTTLNRVLITSAAGLVVTAFLQGGALLWWASSVNTKLSVQADAMTELKQRISRLDDKIDGSISISIRVSALEQHSSDLENRMRDLEKKKP